MTNSHNIAYCNNYKLKLDNCFDCNNEYIKNNIIISCKECNREKNDLWLFNNGNKIWIPKCNCQNLPLTIKNKNMCNDFLYIPKNYLEYGIDIDSDKLNTKNLYNLITYLLNDNIKCFYNCNSIIYYSNKTDIFCNLYNNKLLKISNYFHKGYFNNNYIQLLEYLGKIPNKIYNCNLEKEKAYDFFYEKKKNQHNIVNLKPNCFYKIPIMNGDSLMTKKVKINNTFIDIHGYNCKRDKIKGLIFLNNKSYLFYKDLVYIFTFINKCFKLQKNTPKRIGILFKTIPSSYKFVFFYKIINCLLFITNKFVIFYSLNENRRILKKKIINIWDKLPYSLDSAIHFNNRIYFFSGKYYYIYDLYNIVHIYKNYYFINNNKNIKNYYNALKISHKTNCRLLNVNRLYNFKKYKSIIDKIGWCLDKNEYLYTFKYVNNKINLFKKKLYLFKKNVKNNIGIWCKLKKKSPFILPSGEIIKRGLISDLNNKFPMNIDAIGYFDNIKMFYIINDFNIYIVKSFLNCKKKNLEQFQIEKIFGILLTKKNVYKKMDLCKLEKNNKNFLKEHKIINNNQQLIKSSFKNRIYNSNINIKSRNNFYEYNKETIKSLDNLINTKSRQKLEQRFALRKTEYYNKILIYILTILITFCCIYLIYKGNIMYL